MFPGRGIRPVELRPGLRILGFERRAVIAFQVAAETVTILRILYGGRDLETVFPRLFGLPDGIRINDELTWCPPGAMGCVREIDACFLEHWQIMLTVVGIEMPVAI
jgi:hypothetical protein